MAMCVLARSIKLLAKKMGLLDISGRIISCTKDSTKKIEFVDMADFFDLDFLTLLVELSIYWSDLGSSKILLLPELSIYVINF